MKLKNIGFLLILLFNISVFAEEYNEIDAVTSSSTRFKIHGGKVYKTYAEVEWEDYYSNGTVHELLWGESSSFGKTINLLPFQSKTTVTTKIEGLTPGKTYQAAIHRVYPRKSKDITTKFEFTAPDDAVPVNEVKKNNYSPVLEKGTYVALFTISGEKIASQLTTRVYNAEAVFYGKAARGTYIARITDAKNRVLHSYVCMINK